jgi:hypothetical protein
MRKILEMNQSRAMRQPEACRLGRCSAGRISDGPLFPSRLGALPRSVEPGLHRFPLDMDQRKQALKRARPERLAAAFDSYLDGD